MLKAETKAMLCALRHEAAVQLVLEKCVDVARRPNR